MWIPKALPLSTGLRVSGRVPPPSRRLSRLECDERRRSSRPTLRSLRQTVALGRRTRAEHFCTQTLPAELHSPRTVESNQLPIPVRQSRLSRQVSVHL